MSSSEPIYSPFFGVMGAASAVVFSGEHSGHRLLDEEVGVPAVEVSRGVSGDQRW